MSGTVTIGDFVLGDGHPAFIVGEIGINHNGDIELAKRLIDAAIDAGCNAVKFQKRTPDKVVPPEYRNVMRETPWGLMTYLEYRYRVEFGYEAYAEIDRYCRERGMIWFASCWDEEVSPREPWSAQPAFFAGEKGFGGAPAAFWELRWSGDFEV